MSPRRFVLPLPPSDQSPRQGRRFVTEVLRTSGVDRYAETARLLVSELITNAVLHGRSELEVLISVDESEVRVDVRDLSSRRPAVSDQDEDALNGRGLAIVSRLASRWGVDARAEGKSVWFVLTG